MRYRSRYTNFGGSLKHKERKLLQGGGYVGKSRSEAEAVARTRAACPHIHRFVRCGLWVTLKRRMPRKSYPQLAAINYRFLIQVHNGIRSTRQFMRDSKTVYA